MKLQRIHIKNLFMFKDIEYDFTGSALTLFSGKNSVGKSAFFDLVAWCLYGDLPRKQYKTIIRDTPALNKKRAASCELSFCVNGKSAKVTRFLRYHGNNGFKTALKFFVDGKDSTQRTVTQTQAAIESFVGITYKAFLNIVYFSQDDLGKFLSSNSTERIDILSDLLSLDIYDELRKRVASDLVSYNNKMQNVDGAIKAYGEQLRGVDFDAMLKRERALKRAVAKKKTRLVGYAAALKNYDSYVELKRALEAAQSKAETEINFMQDVVDNIVGELNELKENIGGNVKGKLRSLKAQLEKFNEEITQRKKVQAELFDKSELLAKQRSMIEKTRRKITQAETRIVDMKGVLDNDMIGAECPTCFTKLTKSHADKIIDSVDDMKEGILKPLQTKLKGQMKELSSTQKAVESISQKLMQYEKAVAAVGIIKSKIDTVENYKNRRAALLKRKDEKRKEIKTVKKEASQIVEGLRRKIDKLNIDVDKINTMKTKAFSLSKSIESKTEKLNRLQERRKHLTKVKKQRDAAVAKRDRLDEESKVASYWNNALPLLKVKTLSTAIPFIEQLTNKYLKTVVDKFSVEYVVEPDKARNKVDINIINNRNGVKRLIDGYSGGDKRLISLSIYMALNEVARKRSGNSIEFIVLDEKLAQNDSERLDDVFKLLSMQSQEKQVFVISHIDGVSSYFDRSVEIVNTNGVSRLQYESH